MLRCNLSEIYSLEGYRRIIADYAAANPEAPWILGGGWYMDVFPGGTPTKEVLDAIVPDRPAILTNRDGHGAWVNSRALALAGITRDTPDPADGRIQRTPEGEPSGTLHEGAMSLVDAVAPTDTDEDYAAGLRVAQTYLHSLGITAWQDAIVGIDDSYRR
jgi:predicted amidohydrolase YtcJ